MGRGWDLLGKDRLGRSLSEKAGTVSLSGR